MLFKKGIEQPKSYIRVWNQLLLLDYREYSVEETFLLGYNRKFICRISVYSWQCIKQFKTHHLHQIHQFEINLIRLYVL